jgi:hypothetical protein
MGVEVREVLEDSLREYKRSTNHMSNDQMRAIVRRRIVQWILQLYGADTDDAFRKHIAGSWDICGVVDWQTARPHTASRQKDALHCQAHMQQLY